MPAGETGKKNIHETYLLARKLYEKENYDEALELLETLAVEAPFFADVFNKLGVIYHQGGAFGKATRAFEKSLELNPRYTEASLNLAVTYNNLGRYDDASETFEKAARFAQGSQGALDPFIKGKLANQHADLADIYFDLSLYDEAIEEYRKAVALGRKFADLNTKLAIAYRERGDFDKALEQFQESLKSNASYIPAYLHLGVTYYMNGMLDKAVEVWQSALKADPDAKEVKVYLEFIKDREKKGD
jgi:tetratricopeptide (TPR) repeat protein